MTFIKIFILSLIILFINITVFSEELLKLTNGEWLPYLSKNLTHYGYASHIVTEAFKEVGYTVKFKFYPWKRAYIEAQSGEYDGSIVWSLDKERAKTFLYSDPVIISKDVLFHKSDSSFKWDSFEDFKGVTFGWTIGYKYGNDLENAVAKGLIKNEKVTTDLLNFKKLLAGRIQIFPCNLDVALNILQTEFTPEQQKKITFNVKPYYTGEYYLIISKKVKNSAKLIKDFNKGLKILHNNGKYEKMTKDFRTGKYK